MFVRHFYKEQVFKKILWANNCTAFSHGIFNQLYEYIV